MRARSLWSLASLVVVLAGCRRGAEPAQPPDEPATAEVELATAEVGTDAKASAEPEEHPDRRPPTDEERGLVASSAGHRCLQWIDFDGTGEAPSDHACGFGKVCRRTSPDEAERRAYARVSWAIIDNPNVVSASPRAWVVAQSCAAVMGEPERVEAFTVEQAGRWDEQGRVLALLECAEGCTLGDEARQQVWALEADRGRSERIRGRLAEVMESLAQVKTADDALRVRRELDGIGDEAAKLRDAAVAEEVKGRIDGTVAAVMTVAEPLLGEERAAFPGRMKAGLREIVQAHDRLKTALRSTKSHRFDVLYGKYSDRPVSERVFELQQALDRAQTLVSDGERIGVDVTRARAAVQGWTEKRDAIMTRVEERYAVLERHSPTAKAMCDLAGDGRMPKGKAKAEWDRLATVLRKAGMRVPKAAECYSK